MNFDYSVIKPAWVMCGVQAGPDQVVLFASSDLTQAELEVEADYVTTWDLSARFAVRREFILTTTMRSFVRIEASDWASAFNTLFAQWSPGDVRSPVQIGRDLSIEGGASS